jgi:hypothetical protein
MAAHPDQVWINGTALTQIGSEAELTTNSFYADYATKQLMVGADPRGRDVRASNLSTAITLISPGSRLLGVGVRHYATSVPQMGAVRLRGPGETVEDVVSAGNGTTGLAVLASGARVRHVTVRGNGMLGMHASYANGLVINGLLSKHNNVQHFNRAPVSGGAKIGRSRRIRIRYSIFRDNDGPGLWFDQSCYNTTVIRSTFTGNSGNGIAYEISSTAIVADDTVTDNGATGIKVNDSDQVQVWNNTVVRNRRNINFIQDERRGSDAAAPGHNPARPDPDPTEPWVIFHDTAMDNIIGATGRDGYELQARDSSRQYSSAQLGIEVDGNVFVQPTAGVEIFWSEERGSTMTYRSSKEFTTATGRGKHNVDVTSRNAIPSVAKLASATPVPMSSRVANLLGVPTGVEYVGAF